MTSNRPDDRTHQGQACELAAQTYSSDGLPICGAKTRSGAPCRNLAMRGKRRCRMHGGASTGPKTKAGKERHRLAVTKHGGRSREMIEFRRAARQLRVAFREAERDARRDLVELS